MNKTCAGSKDNLNSIGDMPMLACIEMKRRLPLILTIIMTTYFIVVMLTPFSLTGFWTDNVFALGLVIFSLFWTFKRNTEKTATKIALRFTTILASVLVFGIIGFNLINPFAWTVLETKMVESSSDGDFMIELEYFKPTGAWGCGYGTYWKTKTLKYFPIIEYQTFKNDCTHDDWGYYIKTGKWE